MSPVTQPAVEPGASRIGMRLAWGFLLYLVTGSVALVLWFGHREASESRRSFMALARSDVDFIRELNLPRSEKLARDVSALIGMDIFFWSNAGAPTVPAMDPATRSEFASRAGSTDVFALAGKREGVRLPLDERTDIAFIRPAPPVINALARPATLAALGGFWVLSFALAWLVGREVVRPLVSFSRRLPEILTSTEADLPEATRSDEVGQLARAIISTRDQLAEERLKRERSERLALLGKVATGLAHEIKNPLASIRLHSELAASSRQDAGSAESLRHIQGETRVIEGLVNQWLYLARPDPPKMSPLDLAEVLRELATALRPQADHASVRIQLHIEGELSVLADRQRLGQAIRNIMLNAIQHMPAGGELAVIGVRGEGAVRVSFLDEGRGFSEAALARGAELFFSEREGGMGLGLNVAFEILKAHGGRLSLENDPPRGACVSIILPLHLPPS